MTTFNWPVRVYYEDTDSGGVVYYANYLKFMERARTEWLRHFNIQQDDIRDRFGVIFAVAHVEIDYLLPAQFNDELVVTASVDKQRKASIYFEQSILRENEVLATAKVTVVCLDKTLFKPTAMPNELLEKLVLSH